MTCTIRLDDVPEQFHPDFTVGIHRGGDFARSGKEASECKSEARMKIYSGTGRPFTSAQFWEYQGAMRGIHATTGQCPHCGAKECNDAPR